MPLDVIIAGKPVKFESDKEFLLHSNALLSYRVWDVVSHVDAKLVLQTTVDNELGFPGKTLFTATYSLVQSVFKVTISAKSDQVTLLNATFHPFFNFTENADKILQHDL